MIVILKQNRLKLYLNQCFKILNKLFETYICRMQKFDQLILSLILTLKAPNKNCSRRHFKFLLLSFEKIRLDISCKSSAYQRIHLKHQVYQRSRSCLSEDSLETSSLIFSEKQCKNINKCRLLQS